ncbi:hypothetical protein [Paraburkholderia sp. J11-2]|uniref:hypothetical protein n=1 Tax=Paraburkholderia sp. J11-2 TaxID=2805431 RepID=UPI002AB79F34|nr:hypothetical protein [Paraburkholderia sp. J11-2]
MKALLLALLLPIAAHAADLTGIPQNCQAPLAHDLEMANIPYLLDLGPNAAHITKIDALPSSDAFQYAPNRYKIVCSVTVHWSNGNVDLGYVFSAWEDQYGSIRGSYGRSY